MKKIRHHLRIASVLLMVLALGCAIVLAEETCKVIFHPNYQGTEAEVQTVAAGALLQEPDAPERDGYAFTGWYTNAVCTTAYDFSAPVTGNIRLFAGWEPTCVQVMCYPQNGTDEPIILTADVGSMLTVPEAPERDGYVFTGWYQNAAGSKLYDFSQPVPKHDVTLYAGYEQQQAEITFVLYDQETQTQQVELGGIMAQPEDPVRSGYAFTGWYTAAAGGEAVDFTQAVTADQRIYAHWDKTVADITFDLQYEGGEMAGMQVNLGEAAAEPAAPKRTGYDFTGWYADLSCTALFDFSAPVLEDTTLYAGWTPSMFAVSFDTNNGSGEIIEKQAAYGEAVEAADDPARDGYDFVGWYLDAEGKEKYSFSAKVTGNLTLYAVWQAKSESEGERVISYQYNYDDLGEYTTQTYKATRKMRAPDAPSRSGYYFAGWSRDPEGTVMFDFSSERSTSSFTLYAQWLKGYTFEAEYTYLDGKPGQGTSDNCMGVDLIQTPKDVLGNGTLMGMSNDAYVGKLYYNGAYLDFCINSDRETDNAVLVLRLTPDLYDMRFTDETWQVLVNGEIVKYGRLNLTGAVAQTDFDEEGNTINGDMFKRPFANYVITTALHLQEGENVIRLLTNNSEDHGGTFNANTPLIDCMYVYSSTELKWSKCYPENVGKTMDDVTYDVTYDTEAK